MRAPAAVLCPRLRLESPFSRTVSTERKSQPFPTEISLPKKTILRELSRRYEATGGQYTPQDPAVWVVVVVALVLTAVGTGLTV